MNRQTRKDLKTDKFAAEVTHSFQFVADHRKEAIRYGSIIVVVIALALGYYFYNRHQTTVRAADLQTALKIDDAFVGANPPPNMQVNVHFNTQAEKDTARKKAFGDLAANYPGTQEAGIANFSLASDAADHGDYATAEKLYKKVFDSGPSAYSSLARMPLAQVYLAENKNAEAEKLLRDAIADPTVTLSKEAAQLLLAQSIAKSNPTEARKLLQPLVKSRPALSTAAVQTLSELPPAAN